MRALLDGIRLAIRAVVRNPMRASLTVLGILIGVAAVVTVTALGSGAREHVSQQIQAIGSNFIIVFPQSVQASGARGAQGAGMRLTEDDGRAILRDSSSVLAIAPVVRAVVQVVYGDQNWSTQAVGTTLSYSDRAKLGGGTGRSVGRARRGGQDEGRLARGHRGSQPLRHRRPDRAHASNGPLPVPGRRRPSVEGGGAVRPRSGRHHPHAVHELSRARSAHAPGLRGRADGLGDVGRHDRSRRAPDRRAPAPAASHRCRATTATSRSARRRSSPIWGTRSTAS